MSPHNVASATLAHIRIPAFGCAVAAAKDSFLKHRPLALVTGMHARGRVIEVSPAAEMLGVRYGDMVTDIHRRFRDVIVFPPDRTAMEFAQKALERLMGMFSPQVESVGPGVLALDLSGTKRLWGEPFEAAERVADRVNQEAGFVPCVGLAAQRVVSHVACRVAKPMHPQWIAPETERQFLDPLPVSVLPGLGALQIEKLRSLGIERVGQFLELPTQLVLLALGQAGMNLIQQVRGLGIGPIAMADLPPLQVSESVYPAPDTNAERALKGAVGVLTERSARRLYEIDKRAGHVRLLLTYSDGATVDRSATLDPPSAQELVLLQITTRLLEKALTRRVRVRRLHLVLDRLYQGGIQRVLFQTPESISEEVATSLGQTAQRLRTRFGLDALRLGAAWAGEGYIQREQREKKGGSS